MKTVTQNELAELLKETKSGVIGVKNDDNFNFNLGQIIGGKGYSIHQWYINHDQEELNDITSKMYHSEYDKICFYILESKNNENWGRKLVKIATSREIKNGLVLFHGLSDLQVKMLEQVGVKVVEIQS